MSYAMAYLKADNLNRYRTMDPRIWWHGRKTEKDLRAMLLPGGCHYVDYNKLISEGGSWWNYIREQCAERDGDHELAQALKAEREAEAKESMEALTQSIKKLTGGNRAEATSTDSPIPPEQLQPPAEKAAAT
jgi:hypothetical protein